MADLAAPHRMVMARAFAFDDATGKNIHYRVTEEFDKVADKGEISAFAVRSIYGGACMKLFSSETVITALPAIVNTPFAR